MTDKEYEDLFLYGLDIEDENALHPVEYLEPLEDDRDAYKEASRHFLDIMMKVFMILLDGRIGNRGRARVYALIVALELHHLTDGKTQKKLATRCRLRLQTFNEMVLDYRSKLGLDKKR